MSVLPAQRSTRCSTPRATCHFSSHSARGRFWQSPSPSGGKQSSAARHWVTTTHTKCSPKYRINTTFQTVRLARALLLRVVKKPPNDTITNNKGDSSEFSFFGRRFVFPRGLRVLKCSRLGTTWAPLSWFLSLSHLLVWPPPTRQRGPAETSATRMRTTPPRHRSRIERGEGGTGCNKTNLSIT